MHHQPYSLLDSARRVIDHYIAAIESSPELNSLLGVVDHSAEQRAEVDNGDDASPQRAIQSRRFSSEILWQAPENDAHAAEVQLHWELEQATSYQEQAAGDINELFRFMNSEDTEDDEIPGEEEIPGDVLENDSTQYESISHTKEAAPKLQTPEDQKARGQKRSQWLDLLLNPQDSLPDTQLPQETQKDSRLPAKPRPSAQPL
ncbi:MAG: hypothetical protein LQ346_007271, partial [Caloplaca aetnensis]